MITFQRESVSEVVAEEVAPLLSAHWREIAHYQDIELDPDWEFYRTAPFLRLFTARDEGTLVGYAVFMVARNKHYQASLQAVQDVLFVLPEYRGCTVGYRLIKFSDAQLKAEGVQVVYQHVKSAHRQMCRALDHQGYELVDLIYAKRLDKE
jgi:GNAT superfamily N-acetyltransferase